MSFEKLVILIIVFNVVVSLVKRRAARKNAEAAAGGGASGKTDGEAVTEGRDSVDSGKPARRSGRSARVSTDEGGDWGAEHEETWAEHHPEPEVSPRKERDSEVSWAEREEGRRASTWSQRTGAGAVKRIEDDRERPARDERAGEKSGPLISPKAREKASTLGKDFLTQIAKELGLELPETQERPRPPVPQPQPAPTVPSVPKPILGQKTPASRSAKGRVEEPRKAKPTPSQVVAPIPSRASTDAAQARQELQDSDHLRRAFILKTILEKPLALRPRRPGMRIDS